jgi:hypothetical protein
VLLCFLAVASAREPDVEPLPDAPLALVPFGVAELAWGAPARGAVYAITQAAGLGVGVAGVLQYESAEEAGDIAGADLWQNVAGVAVGAALLSYGVSVVDGSRLAEERARAAVTARDLRQRVQDFDAALLLARAGTP